MFKKIAMFALAVSAAFSNAVAQDDCSVTLSGATVFTGYQIQPSVTKVICGDNEYTADQLTSVSYGANINAGTDAGSVTVKLPNGDRITKNFTIKSKGILVKIEDCEKELGGENPEFSWYIEERTNMSTLQADTAKKFQAELAKKFKTTLASGVEEVGFKFEISNDKSVDLKKLFPNYDIMVTSGYMTITKTKIKVTAKNAGKTYGAADPKLEYTITGNIKEADYKKLGTITLSRAEGENAGTYDISVSVVDETEDYIVTAVPGKFTISPVAASLTVDSFTKIYGETTPEFTYKVSGLIGKDVLKDVTLSCAKCLSTNLENVDEYTITANVKASSNPNYTVKVTNGTLTVTPKDAKVYVGTFEKLYGDKDPTFTFETEGLAREGEELELPKVTRAKGENVGTYKVSVSFAEGSNTNYTLTIVPGSLTINPRPVVLTVTDVVKKFGEKDPELGYTVDALATFDGVKDVLKGVALQREPGEDAGDYAITATVDDEANPNYVVSTVDGKLTIVANNDKIVVTVVGHDLTAEYNGKEQVVKGFDISCSSEAYSLDYVEYTGDSVVTGLDAGKYVMGLSAKNFKNTSLNYPNVTFNITDGVLTITPRKLIVSAKADSITYGDEIPTEFKWFADSLLEGDELTGIHVALYNGMQVDENGSLSVDANGRLAAGKYLLDFDQRNPSNKNYVVSKYEPSYLTVLRKEVVLAIADTCKIYSEADPDTFAYEITGLLEGDRLTGIYVARELGDTVRPAGDLYRISALVDDNPNYTVVVKQGYFTVKPYTGRITVAIYGDVIKSLYTGEEITVLKTFDVSPMKIPGEEWLADSIAYKKEFVAYKGDLNMSGVDMGTYPMGLQASDFVNISPNFERVNFIVAYDGKLVITDEPISIAAVKGVKAFDVSSVNRRIQISGSTVGNAYAVLDMQGKVISRGFVKTPNFGITVQNSGVYMVRIGSSIQRVRVK